MSQDIVREACRSLIDMWRNSHITNEELSERLLSLDFEIDLRQLKDYPVEIVDKFTNEREVYE